MWKVCLNNLYWALNAISYLRRKRYWEYEIFSFRCPVFLSRLLLYNKNQFLISLAWHLPPLQVNTWFMPPSGHMGSGFKWFTVSRVWQVKGRAQPVLVLPLPSLTGTNFCWVDKWKVPVTNPSWPWTNGLLPYQPRPLITNLESFP